MVSKKKSGAREKGRIKIKQLKLNRETVKNLTESDQKLVNGGIVFSAVLFAPPLSVAALPR